MSNLTYPTADFVAFTKIKSTEVNGKFDAIETKFNSTNEINRSAVEYGTAGHVVINHASTGALSSEAQLDETRGGTGIATYTTGDTVYASGANTLAKLAIGSSSQVLTVSGGIPSWATPAASPTQAYQLNNLGLSASVAANALTIALKQADGSTNPSSGTAAVDVGFRSSTATSGAYNVRSTTGALSIVVPDTATLGHTSAMDQYVWVYLLDNAGTPELAVSGVSLFKDKSIASSTTISTSADSGTVLYSTTGRSNVPIRLIGRLTSNQATAGTWATAISDVVLAPTPFPTITDSVEYTPTFGAGLGTPTDVKFFYRREGETLKVHGLFTVGTVAADYASISFPSGLSADTTKTATATTTSRRIGLWAHNNQANEFGNLLLATTSATSNSVAYFGTSTTGTQMLVPNFGNSIMSSGNVMSVTFEVPIAGWSTYGP